MTPTESARLMLGAPIHTFACDYCRGFAFKADPRCPRCGGASLRPVDTPTAHLTEALATITDDEPLTVYGALEMYGPRAVSSLLALNRCRIVWARVGASIVPTLAAV